MERLNVTLLYDAIEDQENSPGADTPVYQQVKQALESRSHRVKTLAAESKVRGLVSQLEKVDADVVFNLCESLGGVDRHALNVASLLELLGKPFTGAGPVGLTLAQDKALAKKIFSFHGLRHPKFSTMDAGQVEWSDELRFPLFVKPLNADSSIGIDRHAVVRNVKELMERISYIHTQINTPALIEEYIQGREIYVGVLGNERMEALPVVEWDFSKVRRGPKIATAEAKWDKESEGYKAPSVFPEDIPEPVYKRIQQAAVEACKALKIYDYGRVDFRLRQKRRTGEEGEAPADDPENCEFFIIEVNPNPYLDQKSEFALAAARRGLPYPDLVERIVELAVKRRR